MKKCIVIGGGFAGLTAAAYLVKYGYRVELIEASPKLGGRAYSFHHKEANKIVDNGQHIMMGCYSETLKFLELINALERVDIQKQLQVKFLKPGFKLYELNSTTLFYPFNLLLAILKYKAISPSERLLVIRLFFKLPFLSNRDLEKMSVAEFLIFEKQNENVRKALWEIISIGALNTSTNKASAKVFVDILKEIFLKGSKGSKIVLPKVGLSEMFCEPAKKFIEERGGEVFLSERVEEIEAVKDLTSSIITDKRRISDFDFIISTVPHFALERILKSSAIKRHLGFASDSHSTMQLFNPKYSSILNVHIWLSQITFGNNFYAFIDSKLHWVFSQCSHLTCVISDADYLMKLSDNEIMEMIYEELENYLNIKQESITNFLIIKEKRATFIPLREILFNRPGTETGIKNLFLAGDWVNTGLPSTIESAVKSGRMTAEAVAGKNE